MGSGILLADQGLVLRLQPVPRGSLLSRTLITENRTSWNRCTGVRVLPLVLVLYFSTSTCLVVGSPTGICPISSFELLLLRERQYSLLHLNLRCKLQGLSGFLRAII